jgi:hypothetical protein
VSRPPWWAPLTDIEATVACDGGAHLLRWSNGDLLAVSHQDIDGELAFAALSGTMAECVAVTQAWRRHSDDLDVLALGPRSAEDQLAAAGEWLGWLQPLGPLWKEAAPPVDLMAALGGPGPQQRSKSRGPSWSRPLSLSVYSTTGTEEHARVQRNELLSLFALGVGFQVRLSASVAAAWSPGGARAAERSRAEPALVAALTGRLAPEVERWLGIDADRVDAALYEGSGWGSVRFVRVDGLARVQVSLPLDWLARVWAPGLGVIGDYLVTEVLEATWPSARVRAVSRSGTRLATVAVRHEAGRWRVVAEENS